MIKPKIKNMLFSIFGGIIIFGIGFLLALLISKQAGSSLKDVMFLEGLFILVIGVMSMMQGSQSSLDISGLWQSDSQYVSYESIDVPKTESQSNNSYQNFLNHHFLRLTTSTLSLAIIFGGVYIIFCSILYEFLI